MAITQIDAVNTYYAVQSTANYTRPQDVQQSNNTQAPETSAAAATAQAPQPQQQPQPGTSQIYLLESNLGQHVNILA